MNSLKNKDKEYIAGTYARFDLVLDSGKGATCKDIDGKDFIDFTSGIGVASLGYGNGKWIEAITVQGQKLQHTSNLFYTSPQIILAEKLIKATGMSKVFFGNSGAEANECAIKVARKYGNSESHNRKNVIITLENSFHGRTMATLTATGQEHYHENFYPFVDGFKYSPANDIDALKALITEDVCGIILELIQGEGGVVPLSKDFVKSAERLCNENDILLIIDEVQTGVGRTGSLFAYEQFDIKPDIVTFATGIGAGLPLGGALLGHKVSDVLGYGDHGTTFGGNPVICAGANVVLDTLTDEFLTVVSAKGEYLTSELKKIPEIYDISGMGLMIGYKVKNADSGDFVKKCMFDGLLQLTAKDKVRLLPPLVISYEEIDKGLEIIKRNL